MSDNRECKVDGCTLKVRALGFCNGHYLRNKRNGDPGAATVRVHDSSRTCDVVGCNRPYYANGMCSAHNQQVATGKAPTTIRRAKGSAADRDDQGRKYCSWGDHWTDTTDFTASNTHIDGLSHRCTACNTLMKFGLKPQQYEELLASQKGGCAICGGTNPNGNALAVDHDHSCCPGKRSCGKCVRGLLCNNCNTGLGMFRDSRDLLASAGWYLRKHGG